MSQGGTQKSIGTHKKITNQLEDNERLKAQLAGPKIMPRTLPREILKWIQVLDLSYSVKDVKKDLSNGFLLAEIFQRYYPLKVQMHSFDNSQNQSRRKNNWELLQLMFSKNDIPIEKVDWEPILLDQDMNAIVNIMSKAFSILTQKKLQKPPLANYMNSKDFLTSTQEMQSGGTASYLLKDKGLERIDERKDEKSLAQIDDKEKKLDGSIMSENKVQMTGHSSKRTNFLRVPSKPIQQNIENISHQIDVKNITVRQVQGSILKLRENKLLQNEPENIEIQQGLDRLGVLAANKPQIIQTGEPNVKQPSQNDATYGFSNTQDGKKKDKLQEQTILDILNNMLMIRFQQAANNEELMKLRGKNINLASTFADQVDEFSDEFVSSFLKEILQQKDAFVNFLFKETNNLWTFFNFCFTCLYNLSHNKHSLVVLSDFIKGFGEKSLQRDPNKTKNIFIEFFLPTLTDKIKTCVFFQKKEIMIQTIFSFCPNDPASKHAMISSVKECLKDMNVFMQVLVVLFQFEDQFTEYNRLVLDDFLLFANQNLFASSTNLRTMSLAIYSHAADLRPDLVLTQLISKIDPISKNQWWECKCLAIIVFSKVIKGIINSDRYNTLVKNPSANQKFFSIENERLINEMKDQVDKFARGIYQAAFPPSSAIILSTSFIYIVEHLGECKILLELFLNLILNCSSQTRYWVLHSDEEQLKVADNVTLQTSGFHSQLNVSHDIRPISNNRQDEEEKEQIEQLNLLNPSVLGEHPQFQYLIYSSRSLKYKSQINSSIIKQFAPQILQLLIQFIKDQEKQLQQLSQEHMDVILFGFENTDFKVINMESCESIANTLKEYILISLCDSNLCHQGKIILLKLLDLQFFSDVKLTDSENLFGSTIGLIYKAQIQETAANMEEIVSHLVEQAYTNGIEVVKQFLVDSVRYLQQKKMMSFIQGTKMWELLENPMEQLHQDTEENTQNERKDSFNSPNQPQQRKNTNMQMIQERPLEKEDSIDPFNEDFHQQNQEQYIPSRGNQESSFN